MTTMSASLPNTRATSPMLSSSNGTATATASPPPHRFSTPPPPPASPVPTDFRSSLSAWWNNTSYKDARLAEERLLRRLAHYQPPVEQPAEKGWFGFGGGSATTAGTGSAEKIGAGTAVKRPSIGSGEHAAPSEDQVQVTAAGRAGESVAAPIGVEGSGLVATLRNVFIPTPNPLDAPAHPADPHPDAVSNQSTDVTASASSSSVTLPNESATEAAAGTCGKKGLFKKSSPASSLRNSIDESHPEHKAAHKAISGLKHGHRGKRSSLTQAKMVDYINTLEISRPEDKDGKEAVVVLHGYAAALGFFFHNWDPVSRAAALSGRRTFFLDWLGMGLSSRPSPSLLSSPSSASTPARVARAEHFFLSSLESWRISVGLEKMVLVGHSLGGYLASAYAVRYPHRVSGLILVSPAGIPHGPEYTKYETTAELDAKRARGEQRIGVGSGAGEKSKRSASPDKAQKGNLDEAVDAAEAELGEGGGRPEAKGEAKQWREGRENSMFRRNAMKFFVWGWEKGLSPFSILRSMGPFGPMFAGRYSLRRFAAQTEEDVRDIHGYIYNTTVLKGSGEYCISHILAPGAYARIPIVDRIHNLKVPVTFICEFLPAIPRAQFHIHAQIAVAPCVELPADMSDGDNDWMDVDGGHASLAALKKAGNASSSVHTVKKAGHHVYLDNPDDTNQIIADAIRAVPKTI